MASTTTEAGQRDQRARGSTPARLLGRITRLEWAVAAVTVVVLVGLMIAEPSIVEAPFENARTVVFTVGGTVLMAIALVVMLRLRVPPVVRILALGLPFLTVSWWLISPFFDDEVVNDEFTTSIGEARGGSAPAADPGPTPTSGGAVTPPTTDSTPAGPGTTVPPPTTPPTTAAPRPAGPTLLGSGRIAGLAGHEGTGDAGFFSLADGSLVLRLENLDIQNGPDLRLYVVPGASQTTPGDGSLYLGELRGNVGNQT